jgi:hypothetical protein
MRIDPFALPRPQRPRHDGQYEEPGLPVALALTLQAPDIADRMRAAQVAEELWDLVVTGKTRGAPAELPLPGELNHSRPLFQLVAMIYVMQIAENPADRYEPLELLGIAYQMPRAWSRLQQDADELITAWETELPN